MRTRRWVQARVALGLAWRSVGRAGDIGALSVVAVAAAVAALVLFGLAGSGEVMAHQEQTRVHTVIVDAGHATGMRAAETSLDYTDRLRIRKIALSGPAASAAPPGLRRFPLPGEIWVSPRLLQLAQDESSRDLAHLWQGSTVHLIGPAGLVSPDELLIYRSTPEPVLAAAGIDPVMVFGGRPEFQTTNLVMVWLTRIALLVFVVVPALVLLAAASMQLAARRTNRVARLGRLGMSAVPSRVAATADGILAALAGAAAAGVMYHLVAGTTTGLPGVPAHWWPTQPQVGLLWVLLVAVIVIAVVAVTLSCATGRPATRARPVRLRTAGAVWLAGIAGLLASWGRRVDESFTNLTLVCATFALVTIGVVLLAPALADRISTRLLRSGDLRSLLAGARIARGPAVARRAGIFVAVAALTATVLTPLIGQAAPRDTVTARVNAEHGRVIVQLSGLPAGTPVTPITSTAFVTTARTRGDQLTFPMPCHQIRRIGADHCPPQGMPVSSLPTDIQASLGAVGDWLLTPGPASDRLEVGTASQDVQALALAETPADARTIMLRAFAAPGLSSAQAENGGLIGGPAQEYIKLQGWLLLALTGLLALAAALILLGLTEDARSRRHHHATLVLTGAADTTLRSSHRREILIRQGSLCATTALSVAITAGAAASWSGTDQAPHGWTTTILISLAALLALAVLGGPLALPRGNPATLARQD